MGSWIRVPAQILLCGSIVSALGQSVSPRAGFAVITGNSGNVAGISASETLINSTSAGLIQTSVSPSAPLTNASMVVNAPLSTAAIAIANPSGQNADINLRLTNEAGDLLAEAAFTLLPNGGFSSFLNEVFVNQVVPVVQIGALLTVTATVPVGVMGLNFRGLDFTSIPVNTIVSPVTQTVPVQTVPVQTVPVQVVPVTTGPCVPTTVPVTMCVPATTVPAGACVGTTTTLTTGFIGPASIVTQFPAPLLTATNPSSFNRGVGLPPSCPPGFLLVSVAQCPSAAAVVTSASPASFNTAVVVPSTIFSPPSVSTVSTGAGTLIFPQVVSGGSWVTEIVLGNTSASAQTISIDFFDSTGVNVGSITDLTIAPAGVFVFSTASSTSVF